MTGPERAAAAEQQRHPRSYREELGGEEPEAVRIWLLGGFRVSVGRRSIGEEGWRLKKAASLIKLLALAPGHRLHREQAMGLLWPELDSETFVNALIGQDILPTDVDVATSQVFNIRPSEREALSKRYSRSGSSG